MKLLVFEIEHKDSLITVPNSEFVFKISNAAPAILRDKPVTWKVLISGKAYDFVAPHSSRQVD